ncbi:hypothetical protein HOLleu_43623 [Holothuria leucospilota]|uniref:Uncharacterized protein n=1 Tax=Holothuria leucospilota TaxID=206669 RepID=A0A9Q0YGR4_HOLLE|nr:hypothetical protein HOLleu_43623 [Holothuria leucospilota]
MVILIEGNTALPLHRVVPKAHIRYFGSPRNLLLIVQSGGARSQVISQQTLWQMPAVGARQSRVSQPGEREHVSGSGPTSYSARASADVGPAHEPSQSGPEPMVEEPRSPSPDEVAHQVEQDFLAAKQCDQNRLFRPAESTLAKLK